MHDYNHSTPLLNTKFLGSNLGCGARGWPVFGSNIGGGISAGAVSTGFHAGACSTGSGSCVGSIQPPRQAAMTALNCCELNSSTYFANDSQIHQLVPGRPGFWGTRACFTSVSSRKCDLLSSIQYTWRVYMFLESRTSESPPSRVVIQIFRGRRRLCCGGPR